MSARIAIAIGATKLHAPPPRRTPAGEPERRRDRPAAPERAPIARVPVRALRAAQPTAHRWFEKMLG
jgi:hypothetical protein